MDGLDEIAVGRVGLDRSLRDRCDMDEIAATALSNTMVCPTCECPKDELDRTDKLYPTRSKDEVRAELLNRDGTIKDRCIERVK